MGIPGLLKHEFLIKISKANKSFKQEILIRKHIKFFYRIFKA